MDELLEMSRRMARRLAELQRDQAEVVESLSRRVDETQQFLDAVGVIVKGQ